MYLFPKGCPTKETYFNYTGSLYNFSSPTYTKQTNSHILFVTDRFLIKSF